MISLPDVNVLIALAWPNHVHHAAAWAWFDAHKEEGWATCTLTEAGFVRVSCNPSAVRHDVTPLDAIAVLQRLTRIGNHTFWPLDTSILRLPESIGVRLRGYRQITDALLLTAAVQRRGRLATLDTGIQSLAAESERRHVRVIPV